MSYLTIDIGNTLIKCGVYKSLQPDTSVPYHLAEVYTIKPGMLDSLVHDYAVEKTIVSSVRQMDDDLMSWIKSQKALQLSHDLKFNFYNAYETPDTLGLDRMAVVAGGAALAGDQPFMVIDAGTCITYEWVGPNRRYEGGAISPGLEMRYKALNTFTGKLPLVKSYGDANFPGKTTQESIAVGVTSGYLAEINELIRLFNNKYPDPIIFLCGGNADFIQNKCLRTMHLEKHLVLLGLLKIMEKNA